MKKQKAINQAFSTFMKKTTVEVTSPSSRHVELVMVQNVEIYSGFKKGRTVSAA